MRITEEQLRRIIREEAKKAKADFNPHDPWRAEDDEDEDDGVDPSVVPNDVESVNKGRKKKQDDDGLMLDAEGLIVEPDVRKSLKRYFAAMGLAGTKPPQARWK